MGILTRLLGIRSDAAGVYSIRNKRTNATYIGSSNHIGRRWAQHRDALGRGTHDNSVLQQDWMRYGSRAFVFSVLEYVPDEENLLGREQYWLTKTKQHTPCYNMKAVGQDGDTKRRRQLRRVYGTIMPADFDAANKTPASGDLLRWLAQAQLVNGEWAWTEEELARFFKSEMSEWDTRRAIQQHRST